MVPQRVGERIALEPRTDLAVDVPDEAVLGSARTVACDRGAVARIIAGQRIGERERAIAHWIEVLQRLDRDGLRSDADPGVAVLDHLSVGDRPADVEVEQVGGVEHLHNEVAAEALALGGPG